jgi:hypothetical protein
VIELPEEVVAFLTDADAFRDPARRINPLSPRESADQTERCRGIPVVDALGLVVLDDANDSNPYCFVSRGPARGMVVHLSHDTGAAFRYYNLQQFLEALQEARLLGVGIDSLPHAGLLPHSEQTAIREILTLQVSSDDGDAASTFALFVALLDPRDIATIRLGANSTDFFIREAVAEFLIDKADPEHRAILLELSRDKHPQVAASARRALAAHRRRQLP